MLVAYSASGGILAGIWVDVFQGGLMAIASSIVFVFALDSGNGLAAISRAIEVVDPALVGPWGARGAMVALSFFFVFAVGSLGQPHIAHKYYMLKDPKRLRWYPALMTVAMILAQLLFVGVGLAVKALVARGEMPALAAADDATPQFLLRYVPEVVSALVFAGVAAAIMSTVNSFLNIGLPPSRATFPRRSGIRSMPSAACEAHGSGPSRSPSPAPWSRNSVGRWSRFSESSATDCSPAHWCLR